MFRKLTYGPNKQFAGKRLFVPQNKGWFIGPADGSLPALDVANVHCSASQDQHEQERYAKLFAAAPEAYECARFVAGQCMAISDRVRNKDKHLSAGSVAAILENMAVVCRKVLDKIEPCTLEADLRDGWIGQGNSKRITFPRWCREMAADDRGTLQDAARLYLLMLKAS